MFVLMIWDNPGVLAASYHVYNRLHNNTTVTYYGATHVYPDKSEHSGKLFTVNIFLPSQQSIWEKHGNTPL